MILLEVLSGGQCAEMNYPRLLGSALRALHVDRDGSPHQWKWK
jgi:hypothetical protein